MNNFIPTMNWYKLIALSIKKPNSWRSSPVGDAARWRSLSKRRRLGGSYLLLLILSWIQPVQAEGSRSLYPSSAPAGSSRADLEWTTDIYGNLVKRRTLLKVYANKDEYILLGSSAVGVGSGDILVYNPGKITGNIGSESIPATPDFKCSSQPGLGVISSRNLELAGPQSISGTGNTSGYIPCYYKAPSSGVYDVVFYGPVGGNSASNLTPTGELNLTSSSNFDTNQGSNVAAWDVTVRSSDKNSTTDLNGRLFAYYLSLFTGGNGRPLYFSIYPITTDGYRYKVDLRGTDPNGFVTYGSQVGFLDSDGKSILYHDVIGQSGQVDNRDGGTSLSRPQYPTFFNSIDSSVVPYLNRYKADGTFDGVGISPPITPKVDSLKFTGTNGNTTKVNTGGTFSFNTNIDGIYEVIISRDGTNFDPTNPQNRVLRGILPTSGSQSITWNGKDNSGGSFPVGSNYPAQVKVHAGEYHFPLLDAENNYYGGPTITMLNATNPLGQTGGFYDDRNYTTVGGTNVNILCGVNPPNTTYSDPINGFDTATNQRAYGQASGGNTNNKCTGSFGDTKGLDLWTYLPSSAAKATLNIIDPNSAAKLLLVKRITAINKVDVNKFVDDPNTTDDNHPNWPTPLDSSNISTYLRGAIDGGLVRPGDEVEYTIYFLSTGQNDATKVNVCDLVPSNTTFIPTAFNGLTPNDGGLSGADSGIALAFGSSTPTVYLTNVDDAPDRGRFYPPGDQATPSFCGSNTNGAVVVNITRSSDFPSLPKATQPGTPANSYGFIRFRTKVK